MTPTLAEYALFDGGVIADSAVLTTLREYPQSRALYADLGAEAANIGPWLAPADTLISELVATLEADKALCSGVSRLVTSASRSVLEQHLHALRYLKPSSGTKKYYFRYADNRALLALWEVLSKPQQIALLGPINAWQITNNKGEIKDLATPVLTTHTPPPNLPLRLSPQRFKQMMAATRIRELLATTLDVFPELRGLSVVRRFELAEMAQSWLLKRRIMNDTIKLAVTATCLRTQGQALEDASFEQTVFEASKTKDPYGILEWRGTKLFESENV